MQLRKKREKGLETITKGKRETGCIARKRVWMGNFFSYLCRWYMGACNMKVKG
jgi:hypothetical protein